MEINREKPFFVGNWKMNKSFNDLEKFITSIHIRDCHQWIAPQTIQLHALREMTKNKIPLLIGSQNHSHAKSGAHTGETSIDQISELGLDFTIVGHSERRQMYNDSDKLIGEKLKLSLEKNIPSILCIGETLEQRESNTTLNIIDAQLKTALSGISEPEYKMLIIAYEPVWAIGTGKTASPEQAQEVHSHIRSTLAELFGPASNETPILYGGSVKPSNVSDLMSKDDIDGALIGGASLEAESYNELCQNGIS